MKKIFLLIALLCAVVQGAWADDYGYPDKSEPNFYGTYKDKHNVVVITSAAELAYINEHFDDESGLNGNKVWKELNYYLDADIDMGTSVSWLPIDFKTAAYKQGLKGTFYGNGHTITYKIWDLEGETLGLFSRIYEGGEVHDLNVVCTINCKADDVGGIASEFIRND